MNFAVFCLSLLSIANGAMGQTTEELRALYSEPTPGEKEIRRTVRKSAEVLSAELGSKVVCQLGAKGRGPEIVGPKDCVCPQPLQLFTVVFPNSIYRLCCTADSVPRVMKQGTRLGAICAVPDAPAARDAGTSIPAQ